MKNINKLTQTSGEYPAEKLPSTGHDPLLAHQVLSDVLSTFDGPVSVKLWNGEEITNHDHPLCTVVFRQPEALRDLLWRQDVVKLAEHYLAGTIEIEGELERVFELAEYLEQVKIPRSVKMRALWFVATLPRGRRTKALNAARSGANTHVNSSDSIAHHYDVGNDFYRLWLDPEMVYSCAYFKDEQQTLAAAQQDKLDYICRKLRLQPGQKLLDIGCGWGALIRWAARHYGVSAHGITLSEQQYTLAHERIQSEGLQDQVSVELRDYRDLPHDKHYDRIVSVGMFEHIGINNFPVYFSTVSRLLKPGGLFLNHGITNDTGWTNTPFTKFVNDYVFPDGELARISDVSAAMEAAGFEIIDTEGLRRHYALTLRRWIQALDSRRQEAIAVTNEVSYRLWRLYMAGSAYFFERGSTGIYQVLAGHRNQPLSVPLRRNDLYE
ncbi:MAG: class I SAM-dependent methyltransferase [Acidiferrobacterales bacterium]